jgi:hypothetical protein
MEPFGDGFDVDGREAITYIPGSTPHPRAWDDHAVSVVGALLRRLHDATESDWEFAGPVDALWKLAETAWLNAQLHDDDIAERAGLPSAARRGQQVRLLLDAYGLPPAEQVGFVDRMIEFAVHSARAEAVRYSVTPDTAAAVDPSGYPFLWAITWRARSASWMLRHRQILERALA